MGPTNAVAMSDHQIVYWVIAAGIIFPYCAAALIRWRRRSQELRAPEAKKTNNYFALRAQILNWKCPQASSSTPDRPDNPCAVVMDWAVTSGVATVVAVSDGSASIYYSGGGGSIGGGDARPAIRDAGVHAVSIADRKSTRLNSSHSQISYAVFCLKKKKILHNRYYLCTWFLIKQSIYSMISYLGH